MSAVNDIKFTVITVIYNAENSIRKTVESVLYQKMPPYEYLIIDGKSTDRTLEIVQEYKAKFEERGISLAIVSEKDTGIYNAMNKGIRKASGDFISFLNAGDWYQTDALYNVNEFYKEESFDLTYGGLNYINPNGTAIVKMSRMDTFPVTSRHWNHPSMFLKREIYQKYAFDERYPTYADFDLYLKLRKDGTKIRVIDKVIANFVADGVSTAVGLKKVLKRAKEKYTSYRRNGYGCVYWLEAYGWELMKALYFKIKS